MKENRSGPSEKQQLIQAVIQQISDEVSCWTTTRVISRQIDDDEEKIGCTISGVRVLGDRNDIISICEKYKPEIIFFAISKIKNKDKKDIIEICQQTGIKVRILPSTEDIIRNKNLFQNLREVDIEDILGRDPVKLDNNKIGKLIENKTTIHKESENSDWARTQAIY